MLSCFGRFLKFPRLFQQIRAKLAMLSLPQTLLLPSDYHHHTIPPGCNYIPQCLEQRHYLTSCFARDTLQRQQERFLCAHWLPPLSPRSSRTSSSTRSHHTCVTISTTPFTGRSGIKSHLTFLNSLESLFSFPLATILAIGVMS